jgi:hypothetical protein
MAGYDSLLVRTGSLFGSKDPNTKLTEVSYAALVKGGDTQAKKFKAKIIKEILVRLGFPGALNQIENLKVLYGSAKGKDPYIRSLLDGVRAIIVQQQNSLLGAIDAFTDGTSQGGSSLDDRIARFDFNEQQYMARVVESVVGNVIAGLQDNAEPIRLVGLLNKEYAISIPGVVGALISNSGGRSNKRARR